MNDILYEIFKKTPDKPAPASLHQTIVRRVLFARAHRTITFVFAVVSISFAFSVWHVYARAIDLDFITIARTIIPTIEFNIDSILDGLGALFGLAPVGAIMLSLLNLLALGVVARLLRVVKHMEYRHPEHAALSSLV